MVLGPRSQEGRDAGQETSDVHGEGSDEHQKSDYHSQDEPTGEGSVDQELEQKEHLLPDEHEHEESDGVELGVYLSWIKEELENERACLQLPFTIILLVAFSCLALLHLKQDNILTVEGALRRSIERAAPFNFVDVFAHDLVYDIFCIGDIWSWLRHGFLPLAAQQTWAYSESLQAGYDAINSSSTVDNFPGSFTLSDYGGSSVNLPTKNEFNHFNRIVAGIRLRQERSPLGYDLCRFPTSFSYNLWREWLGKPCVPARPPMSLYPEPGDTMSFGRETRVEWLLPALDPLKQLQLATLDMEIGCAALEQLGRPGGCLCSTCTEAGVTAPWIDEQTQRVEIGFVSYNSGYGIISLITVTFWIDRGGLFKQMVNVRSAYSDHWSGPTVEVAVRTVCDIVFLSSVTLVLVVEVRRTIQVIRTSHTPWYKSLWNEYISFWTAVEWLLVICAYLLFGLYLRLYLATVEVNREFEDLIRSESSSRAEYISRMHDMFDLVQRMCDNDKEYRMSLMLCPMVVMFRLFKSFAAQPRLAMVSTTITSAGTDLVHFGIVFMSVYYCLAVNSVLLFGKDVGDFSTLDRAAISCFQVMFGKMDVEAMNNVGIVMAGVWLWTFHLVVIILLLNMILAILMDTYSRVKSRTENVQTLLTQISEMARRRRQFRRKERVRLNDIWDAYLADFGGDETRMTTCTDRVTPKMVAKKVKGIPSSQAERTLANAVKALAAKNWDEYTHTEVRDDLRSMDTRMRMVHQLVQDVKHTVEKTLADSQGSDDSIQVLFEKHQFARTPAQDAGSPKATRLSTVPVSVPGLEVRQSDLDQQQAALISSAMQTRAALLSLREQTDRGLLGLQRSALLRERAAPSSVTTRPAPAPSSIGLPRRAGESTPGGLTAGRRPPVRMR